MMNIFSRGKRFFTATLVAAIALTSASQAENKKQPTNEQLRILTSTLELDVPRLERLSKQVKDPNTLKHIKDVVKHAEKIIRAGQHAKVDVVQDALSTVQKAITHLKQNDMKLHYISSSSSSSSSSCDLCSEISDLDSEVADCCGAIKSQIYDILRLLQSQYPCGAFIEIDHVPFTILESGKYCVSTDLVYKGSGVAITVSADNVSINFHNHSLTLTNPNAQGILVQDVSEFTLENDIIQGSALFSTATSAAIHLENVRKATLSNVYTYNTTKGVQIERSSDVLLENSFMHAHVGLYDEAAAYGAGVSIEASDGVSIDSCTFEGSALEPQGPITSYGMLVFGESTNIILQNSTFTNWLSSITVRQVTGMIIEHCLAIASSFSDRNLMQLGGYEDEDQRADDVIIRNATFVQHSIVPGFDGLLFIQGAGCLLENVIVDVASAATGESEFSYLPGAVHIGCTFYGGCDPALSYNNIFATNCTVTGTNEVGLFIEYGSDITFTHSLFTDATGINIYLARAGEDGGAVRCQIKDSKISNSQGGHGVYIEAGTYENAVVNCEVSNNGNTGIYIEDSSYRNHLRGNRVFGNRVGIFNNGGFTETYFNTSCNNSTQNCYSVYPQQAPYDFVVAGSNICCPIEE